MLDRPPQKRLLILLLALSLMLQASSEPRVWPAWRAMTCQGKDFHSRKLDGKVVVMAMWASWCPSSRKQLPILNSMQRYYKDDGLFVLSFSFDHSENTHEKFVREQGLQFPSIFARTGEGLQVVRRLQNVAGTLEAVPTVLIYDRHGRLAHRLVGYFNRKQLDDLVRPLLLE